MDAMREVLEHLNAYRFALSAALLFIIIRYLWLARRSLRTESAALAGALGLLALGDDMIRLVVWLARRAANDGMHMSWPYVAVGTSIIGGVIATIGAIWMIKVLSPPECRFSGWIAAVVGSGAFAAGAAWW